MTVSHLKRFSLSSTTWESSENLHLYPESDLTITASVDKLKIYEKYERCNRMESNALVEYTWAASLLVPVTV